MVQSVFNHQNQAPHHRAMPGESLSASGLNAVCGSRCGSPCSGQIQICNDGISFRRLERPAARRAFLAEILARRHARSRQKRGQKKQLRSPNHLVGLTLVFAARCRISLHAVPVQSLHNPMCASISGPSRPQCRRRRSFLMISRRWSAYSLLENWFAQPLYVEQSPVSSMIFLMVWAQPPHFAAQPSDA